jgi:hypothetical protein
MQGVSQMSSLNWNQIEEQANRQFIEREAVKAAASGNGVYVQMCGWCKRRTLKLEIYVVFAQKR